MLGRVGQEVVAKDKVGQEIRWQKIKRDKR